MPKFNLRDAEALIEEEQEDADEGWHPHDADGFDYLNFDNENPNIIEMTAEDHAALDKKISQGYDWAFDWDDQKYPEPLDSIFTPFE